MHTKVICSFVGVLVDFRRMFPAKPRFSSGQHSNALHRIIPFISKAGETHYWGVGGGDYHTNKLGFLHTCHSSALGHASRPACWTM